MSINFNKVSSIPALGIFLAVFCGIAACVMAYSSIKTEGPIKAKKLKNIQTALGSVLPEFDNDLTKNMKKIKSEDGVDLTFYGAAKNGKLVGIAVETSTKIGYAGAIDAVVSLNLDGTVRTITVTKNNETPGLGSIVCARKEAKTIFTLCSKADAAKPALPPNRFLDWYAGKVMPADGWKVRKDGGDAEYMTGATVSCRAIADLTNRAAKTFKANKIAIIKDLTPKEVVK